MAIKIKFGTDGWRAAIADSYTFENVRRCAQGFASYLLDNGNKGNWVVVGYDKRFLSEKFAEAVAETLIANGLKVYLTDKATPTPVISFSVVNKKACGAVNITASHNPASDNGFKVRDQNGGAIDPKGLIKIEKLIPDALSIEPASLEKAQASGDLVIFDPDIAYIEQIKSLLDLEPIKKAGLRIVVDPMWGNGIGWYKRLLGGDKTEIIEIHDVRNPIYPEMNRPEPIPPNINVGLKKIQDEKADVLVILDGDADRVGIGDENGVFVNQLQVYALLAYYFLEIRKMRGPIVKTLSTTSMLDKLGKLYNVQVAETGVGFKYVAPKMMELDALIGGEESGGYAFRGHVPERDGILAGLFMLDMMVKTGQKPSELVQTLFKKVGAHYYDRIDRPFSGDRSEKEKLVRSANPQTIGGLKVTGLNDLDGFKFLLEDGGWALIRFSGTEPIIRAYCETTHPESVQSILADCLKIVGLKA
jgi:alpha-D-glucose phosphate-specific phosphoglucomutase